MVVPVSGKILNKNILDFSMLAYLPLGVLLVFSIDLRFLILSLFSYWQLQNITKGIWR